MYIGDIVRVKKSWESCYPEIAGVVGVVIDVIQLRNGKRIRWMHGYKIENMPPDVLEVLCV